MQANDLIYCHDPNDMSMKLDALNNDGFKAFVYDKDRYIIKVYALPEEDIPPAKENECDGSQTEINKNRVDDLISKLKHYITERIDKHTSAKISLTKDEMELLRNGLNALEKSINKDD